MRQAHRDEELVLRKRKYKIESEVENWIHKYDAEMEEKQTELDEITVSGFCLEWLYFGLQSNSRLYMLTKQISCKACKHN